MATSRVVAVTRVARRARRTETETRDLHRAFFENIKYNMNFNSLQDLSKVTTKELLARGGGAILKHYNNSPSKALRELFPEIEWNPLSFSKVPQNFWQSERNQKGYLEGISATLKFASLNDWYTVSQTSLQKQYPHLTSLLSKFDGSLRRALEKLFPEHTWDQSRFLTTSGGYWDSHENQFNYLSEFAKSKGFNIEDVERWYKVKQRDLAEANGRGLLARFEDSHSKLLMSVLKDLPWDLNRFETAPRGHWKSVANQRLKLDSIFNALGLKSSEDWYSITFEKILEVKGSAGLLALHNNSLSEVLRAAYPEHDWKGYRFTSTSHGLHENWAEVEKFIKDAEQKLRIRSSEDWYRVSQDLLWRLGGGQLVAKNGGLYQVLKKIFPEVVWDEDKLCFEKFSKKSSQRWLFVVLCDLFDETKTSILENHSHETLKYPASSQPIELDVFLPDLKLAFEYQGKQHYQDTMIFGLSQQYKYRDLEKKRICSEAGITLIEVPYWWDGSHATLARTTLDRRPDLYPSIPNQYRKEGASIPRNPSSSSATLSQGRKSRVKKKLSVFD